MAFTGVAVVKQVADNLVRITGLSLADSGISGTIALKESIAVPGVRLNEGFKPREYKNAEGHDVSLQDSIQVEICGVATGIVLFPIMVVKTGTMPTDFLITLTDTAALEAGSTGNLEIYIRFH